MVIAKLCENVYWVGSRDWNRRLFDALIPLPKGTSYNAYLIMGEKENVLIDTVNPGFERELEENISRVTSFEAINYVVMNHAEPDHAGAIPYVMKLASNAKLITTGRGAKNGSKILQCSTRANKSGWRQRNHKSQWKNATLL